MIPLARKFKEKNSAVIFDETKVGATWNKIVQKGNIVYIDCGLQSKEKIAAWTDFGRVPEEFKPTVDRIRIRTSSYNNTLIDIEIKADGNIRCNDKEIIANQVFAFTIMYFID